MKKGFTLMEILAVLLIIAVLVSAAVPVFRSVRFETKNSQAKTAVKKMAEAMRTYYQVSRGSAIEETSFDPTSTIGKAIINSTTCTDIGGSGVPKQSIGGTVSESAVSNLFGCGFLSRKDFVNVPYTFQVCNPRTTSPSGTCNVGAGAVYAVAKGLSADTAGKKYYTTTFEDGNTYRMYVTVDMQVKDNAD